jgi:hypothetical protein
MHQGTTKPPGVTIELRILARQATYRLDLAGKTPEDFERLAREAAKLLVDQTVYPPTPKVDLLLEIHNTGTQDMKVLLGGSMHGILIEVDGPGAVNFTPRVPVVAMVFPPDEIALAPGASHSLPMNALPHPATAGGLSLAYWTQPGEYTLTAHWSAGISPCPRGSEEIAPNPGFGYVAVTSSPVKVQVTA